MNRPGLLAVECRSMHLATPPPHTGTVHRPNQIKPTPIADEPIHCIQYTVTWSTSRRSRYMVLLEQNEVLKPNFYIPIIDFVNVAC